MRLLHAVVAFDLIITSLFIPINVSLSHNEASITVAQAASLLLYVMRQISEFP